MARLRMTRTCHLSLSIDAIIAAGGAAHLVTIVRARLQNHDPYEELVKRVGDSRRMEPISCRTPSAPIRCWPRKPVVAPGFYKVPSLRGVWYRGPFEHDGSCATLEDWFNFARTNDADLPTRLRPATAGRAGWEVSPGKTSCAAKGMSSGWICRRTSARLSSRFSGP